jgi:antitoxin ParD1/3/4
MQIQLSEKAQSVLNKKIASGFYSNVGEYLSTLILRADEYDRLKLERLRTELQIGIDELDRGEGVPFSRDEITKEIETELGYTE